MFYVTTVLVLIYLFIDITWRIWKRNYSFLPNAPNIPWLGSAPWLGSNSHTFYNAVTTFATKYNHLYILWVGPSPVIRAGTVKYVEKILKNQEHITKSVMYESFCELVGTGLITSTGKKWKKRRLELTPALHFSILNDFVNVFVEHAHALVTKIEEMNSAEVDIQHLSALSALDVMCETSMGVKVNALNSAESSYVQSVFMVKKLIIERILNPFLKWRFVYLLTQKGCEFYQHLNILHIFTVSVINQNIAARKQVNDTDTKNVNDNREGKYKKKRVFLDLLIDLYDEGEIDLQGIQEEVDTFMFAGHDTTSTAISWSLYEIARHPDVQHRLQEEIDQIKTTEDTLSEQIRSFRYLDIVVKECLRFHPPVPMYGRAIEEDLLFDDGVVIPAGTEYIIEAFSLHMNEEYWDEPRLFKPERFESERFLKRNPYSFVPFSAGPRNCIGQRFALLEIKIFLFCVLSKFSVKAVQSREELQICYDLVTYSMNGIKLKFESR